MFETWNTYWYGFLIASDELRCVLQGICHCLVEGSQSSSGTQAWRSVCRELTSSRSSSLLVYWILYSNTWFAPACLLFIIIMVRNGATAQRITDERVKGGWTTCLTVLTYTSSLLFLSWWFEFHFGTWVHRLQSQFLQWFGIPQRFHGGDNIPCW